MWWPKKREPELPPDVHEARQLRAEAQEDLVQLKKQANYVSELASRLIERRILNHFGDEIQITFTPRGGHRA